MIEWLGEFYDLAVGWISANAWWILIFSLIYSATSLFLIRLFVINLPADYFTRSYRPEQHTIHPILKALLLIAKNLAGMVLLLIGLIMAVPGVAGQGILTIIIGLSLMDFPGKRKMEFRLVRQPIILRTINSIREKAGKPQLQVPGDSEG